MTVNRTRHLGYRTGMVERSGPSTYEGHPMRRKPQGLLGAPRNWPEAWCRVLCLLRCLLQVMVCLSVRVTLSRCLLYSVGRIWKTVKATSLSAPVTQILVGCRWPSSPASPCTSDRGWAFFACAPQRCHQPAVPARKATGDSLADTRARCV